MSGGDRREGEVRVRDGTGDGPPNKFLDLALDANSGWSSKATKTTELTKYKSWIPGLPLMRLYNPVCFG